MGLTVAVDRAIDGVEPRDVVHASRVEDVVTAIREANASSRGIVLWGGGTRISVGDAPSRYDVALDLTGLRGIVSHEPADLVVTVRAGTTLAELADALGARGQRWPVEAAFPERATVGGTIASAAEGPSRLRYFHPRDWVLGVQAVLGDGTLTRAGGRVVKNVTGYDLTKLYAGSYGTLCAITEVTLKLVAVPERVVTLRLDLLTSEQAYAVGGALLEKRLPLDALAVVNGPVSDKVGAATWNGLFVRLAGSARVVERLEREVRDSPLPIDEVPSAVWQRLAALPHEARTSTRVSYAAGLMQPEPGEGGGLRYPGVEIQYLFDEDDAEMLGRLRIAFEAKGGALVLERTTPEIRRAIGTWGTTRIPAPIARRLKELFDQRGVLAPGRLPLD